MAGSGWESGSREEQQSCAIELKYCFLNREHLSNDHYQTFDVRTARRPSVGENLTRVVNLAIDDHYLSMVKTLPGLSKGEALLTVDR